ncbi:MAG: c-type cytochrome [Burkholderiales bacterium]
MTDKHRPSEPAGKTLSLRVAIVMAVFAAIAAALGAGWLTFPRTASTPTVNATQLPEPDAAEARVITTTASAPTVPAAAASASGVAFMPPLPEAIPEGPYGDAVRRGHDIFVNTQVNAKAFVGNGLNCVNCHLDAGRKAGAAPLWAAFPMFPAYRDKNHKVNSMEDRLAGCFTFSMNGKPPAYDSPEMVALVTYSAWLATGASLGTELPGRGYPKLEQSELAPDATRGVAAFEARCAICHGADGQGLKQGGAYAFPPLWGAQSYNAGAGMHNVATAAAFIRANMPLGLGGTLSVQDAWDISAYINRQPRPPDPRKQ